MICHSHLRTLHIDVAEDGDLGILFEHLLLPSLSSFSYNDRGFDTWPQAQFVALVSRSSCSLQKLHLFFVRGELMDDELIECLRLMPSLVHLQLDGLAGFGVTDKALALLTLPNSKDNRIEILVPKLQCIRFDLRHSAVLSCCFGRHDWVTTKVRFLFVVFWYATGLHASHRRKCLQEVYLSVPEVPLILPLLRNCVTRADGLHWAVA